MGCFDIIRRISEPFPNLRFENINMRIITDINKKVALLISEGPILDEVDIFSQQYYKYFE